jgi:hypothetical protein
MIWGTPERGAEQLRAFGAAGLRHVTIGLMTAMISQRGAAYAVYANRRIAGLLSDPGFGNRDAGLGPDPASSSSRTANRPSSSSRRAPRALPRGPRAACPCTLATGTWETSPSASSAPSKAPSTTRGCRPTPRVAPPWSACMRWAVDDVLAYSPKAALGRPGAAMPQWGGTAFRIGSSRQRRSVRSPMRVEASRLSIRRVRAYEEVFTCNASRTRQRSSWPASESPSPVSPGRPRTTAATSSTSASASGAMRSSRSTRTPTRSRAIAATTTWARSPATSTAS